MASTNDITSVEAWYEILPDGSRRTRGGHLEKQCTISNKWIETGETVLINHEGKRRCLATVHDNQFLQRLLSKTSVKPHFCRLTLLISRNNCIFASLVCKIITNVSE